ncbi:hypothetical protein EF888_02860 [Silicimonas algicola]|uniref:4-amino-4-deoxy-L-arabinose transferase-like glycosyltransferase n=1 Tax=Silicimonas algicola TaxID=1826607 RepID=A0A316GC25_9RHOB|nr:hypothetical protein [Silicimonas algicola]AZQ66161.1 hypothetical protein EF888_02860 [Silicimonas algicola]PWK58468.1 hypothetical protein C8D95_101282 [Silicimonas algicola]
MSRPNPLVLAAVLLAFTMALGGLPFLKGGLYLDAHEGDTYHLLDILFRMREGQVPHLDFPTPLGVFSVLPFAWLLKAGYSVGTSIILGQLLVALSLWPLATYAALRLTRGLAFYFGLVTLGLVVALSYGTATSGATISMHYNRWGWALSFVAVVLAFLPARRERQALDGALIGLLCAVLLLIKVTYFVAVAPAAGLALVARGQGRAVLWAALTGLAVAVAVTAAHGIGFWLAYLGDLRAVAASEVRPFVGVPFQVVLTGPVYMGATLTGIAAVFLVRRAGHGLLALGLLWLVAGSIYVTYQNFGNVPQWLYLMPVLLLALRPATDEARVPGGSLRQGMTVLAIIAVTLEFPSLYNAFRVNFEHLAFDPARFVRMLPDPAQGDLFIRTDRGYMMTANVDLDRSMPQWARYSEVVDRPPLAELKGATFPACEWMAGSRAYFETLGQAMAEAGVPEGGQVFVADILSAFWLFGDLAPLGGGAPWYYGGLTGLDHADFVMVPKCSFVQRVRGIMVEDLKAVEDRLELVRDDDLMALYRVSR